MTLQDYFIDHAALKGEWAFDKNAAKPGELMPHSRVKVWWRCTRGHEWQAAVDSRVYAGRGCPVCVNQAVIAGENDMATVASEMAGLWHPTRNGDLNPSYISPGSKKQIWWQCQRGHSWRAAAFAIKRGNACPYCAGREAIPGETDLATVNPDVAKMWSAKNKLSPTQVTVSSHKKVWWVCKKGHEWEAVVGSVASEGYGCPYCAGKRAIPGETDLATLRPDILGEWDTEKNAPTDPREVLPSSHEKVWWRCALGHSYQAVVFSRTKEKGSGCPYCSGRLVLRGYNDLATRKPKIAEEWYQALNGELKPEDVTLGSNKKVWWQCHDGHVWRAAVYSRTRRRGSGCPVCAGTVKQRRSGVEPTIRQKKTQSRLAADTRPASINT